MKTPPTQIKKFRVILEELISFLSMSHPNRVVEGETSGVHGRGIPVLAVEFSLFGVTCFRYTASIYDEFSPTLAAFRRRSADLACARRSPEPSTNAAGCPLVHVGSADFAGQPTEFPSTAAATALGDQGGSVER